MHKKIISRYSGFSCRFKILLNLTVFLLFIMQIHCKSKLQSEIEKLIETRDFIGLAVLCSEKSPEEFKEQCEIALKESIYEIESILSEKSESPFTKLIIEKGKALKIQKLLTVNTALGIRYRLIWEESVMEVSAE
ncbi:MAG: hypothetical protein K8R21_14550 [Leptospira sp.]|nr:hypothetical protein [Leptospira sp.]